LRRAVLDVIDGMQGSAQERFEARRTRLLGDGWTREGKASAGDLEFFNKDGVRVAVAIESDDPRLPQQRMYNSSD
jgi:hypothetical protein